jgi:glutamyl/glutaminyl-tRNA synthetase
VADVNDAGRAYLESIVAMATGSVDRINEVPSRLRFLFAYDPREALARGDVREVLDHPGAGTVIEVLADELSRAPRLDRDTFHAVASAVKQRTGQKARGLFHPIRVALTGAAGGPELDVAVPAIDRGASLPPHAGVAPILGCRERAHAFAAALSEFR